MSTGWRRYWRAMRVLALVAAVEWTLDYAMGADLALRGALDLLALAGR